MENPGPLVDLYRRHDLLNPLGFFGWNVKPLPEATLEPEIGGDPTQLAISCNIELFFQHIRDVEELRFFIMHMELEEHITTYYGEGNRPCIRPSSHHPFHVRRLLTVCFEINLYLTNEDMKNTFFSLRPPILYMYRVRYYGNSTPRHLDSFRRIHRHYGADESKHLLPSIMSTVAISGDIELLDLANDLGIEIYTGTLCHVVRLGNHDAFRTIVNGRHFDITKYDADAIVRMYAFCAAREDLTFLRMLVMAGFNVNAHDPWRGTPLEYCMIMGSMKSALELLDYGARTDLWVSRHSYSILTLAVHINCSVEEFQKLLQKCDPALLQQKDYHGYTPLETSRLLGRLELEIFLIPITPEESIPAPPYPFDARRFPLSTLRMNASVGVKYYHDEFFEIHDHYAGKEDFSEMVDEYPRDPHTDDEYPVLDDEYPVLDDEYPAPDDGEDE